MKTAKRIVLTLAFCALLLTLTPLVSYAFTQDPGTGGGGGGKVWTVTCQYDGSNTLLSKTCVSGGSESCSCPKAVN